MSIIDPNYSPASTRARPSTGHVALVKRARAASWYVRIRAGGAGGRQVQRRLGPAWTERGRPPAGWYTRKLAEAELRQMLTDLDRGTSAMAARSGVTFADAAAEFLRFVTDTRRREVSTISDYRGVIDGYLLPRWGDRDIESISADEIEVYRDRLLTEGRLSVRSVARHLVVLNGIFRRAMRVWELARNPASAELVERPSVRYSGEFVTLTPDEVRLLANHADGAQDAALIVTAAFTGLRLGELLALRWRDLDFSLQRVHVRRSLASGIEKAPKSGRVRSAPLVDEVIAALDGLSRREWFTDPDDLVFCSVTGEHLCDMSLRRRFYKALQRAGLPRIRLHDLRHCFATLAVQHWELPKVQGYLGHAHISTTMRYVHHAPAVEDAAKLSAALRGDVYPPVYRNAEIVGN